MESAKQTSDCPELNAIKYKSMMMRGSAICEPVTNNVDNLDAFLEREKIANTGDPWSKLDKTAKTRKLIVFVQQYKEEHDMTTEEADVMLAFLKDVLDRKRLARVKDVIYDKTTGLIKEIPSLHFNRASTHFTLKNTDKQRTSTLKSLPPKKVKAKNILIDTVDIV
jgi:hypothetical protein